MKSFLVTLLVAMVLLLNRTGVQGFSYNFEDYGNRVCLVSVNTTLSPPRVVINLLDADQNKSDSTFIFKRPLYGTGSEWQLVAAELPPGTEKWTDNDVKIGDVWEYQVKRKGTWKYQGRSYDATGYVVGALLMDNTGYQGRLILLTADNIKNSLAERYQGLKKDLTGEGWLVHELVVPRAHGWDNGSTVQGIRQQIARIYHQAPIEDKPKLLFILGHVPMPRSGSFPVTAADGHDENRGARGCDAYYADVDGIYTDANTFDPGGLQTDLAVNRPNDFKWDQDFFPSDIEMGFGRVNFADIQDYYLSETDMMASYLDKLHCYKHVLPGFEMGQKSAFFRGHTNSNDASLRNLPLISKASNVLENRSSLPHSLWVKKNGPFMVYMRNKGMPRLSEWNEYGMAATVFSGDQSYWGYNDVPQTSKIYSKLKGLIFRKEKQQWQYSRIRSLLASRTNCLVALWTTTGIGSFFQSCVGEPLGLAVRQSMNHTPQEWDTRDWWNRTHFAYNGDPSLRLYQVKPPRNVLLKKKGTRLQISWDPSPDTSVIGYHVYRSGHEFGPYKRLTGSRAISDITFTDARNSKEDWYMVRAIKVAESGCGIFLNPSIGIFVSAE